VCVAEWMTDGSWRLLSTHPPEKPPEVNPPPTAHVRLLILYLISEQQGRAVCPLSTKPNEESASVCEFVSASLL